MTVEGKQKFISQAEAFINLIRPRQVIPMHFWSLAYKEAFFNYLENMNQRHLQYQILRTRKSQYRVVKCGADLIQVIDLERGAFQSFEPDLSTH